MRVLLFHGFSITVFNKLGAFSGAVPLSTSDKIKIVRKLIDWQLKRKKVPKFGQFIFLLGMIVGAIAVAGGIIYMCPIPLIGNGSAFFGAYAMFCILEYVFSLL